MSDEQGIELQAQRAATHLSAAAAQPIRFGLILGTGSGAVADNISIDHEFNFGDIPHFPQSTALGHKGSLLFGQLESHRIIAMNGRFHLYEGHDVDTTTLAVRVMHKLGVRHLLITNAAGGLNPDFICGDIVNIRSHIDLMCRASNASSMPTSDQRPNLRTDIYDASMASLAHSAARSADFVLHDGVYAGLLGPTYETRAEYRMLRRIGADLAGMSTIPEVYIAAQLQIRVLALSVVTNIASPDTLTQTSGHEVVAAGELAAPRIHRIISDTIKSL